MLSCSNADASAPYMVPVVQTEEVAVFSGNAFLRFLVRASSSKSNDDCKGAYQEPPLNFHIFTRVT